MKFIILATGYFILAMTFKFKIFEFEWIMSTIAMTMAFYAGEMRK